MDSSKQPVVAPSKSRLARTFVKVLHARTATGIAPVDGFQKITFDQKIKDGKGNSRGHKSFDQKEELPRNKVEWEALLARVFASVSCIKAAYAELQLAQSPYDADTIKSTDNEVVSELKVISELKQCYLKKQFDAFTEKVLISSEIQEQKSLLKTYEIVKRKLESQLQFKESEIASLQVKLEEYKKDNRSMEKRLNASGQLPLPDNLHLSGLGPTHFIPVLRHTIKSIRSFVKLMVDQMLSSGWDLDAAASAIHPGVVFWKKDHKCFAFESFVCREMFDGFHHAFFLLPCESLPEGKNRKGVFFERFMELKSVKAKDCLTKKPNSTFGRFCRDKYLRLVHTKMESSLFGNLNQRNIVNSGEFPETKFFTTFAEMAMRVWLLHCLAFSFETPAMIFQVRKGCRFSDVFMDSVADEPFLDTAGGADTCVAFTAIPGFKLGKTVIQSQVYVTRS